MKISFIMLGTMLLSVLVLGIFNVVNLNNLQIDKFLFLILTSLFFIVILIIFLDEIRTYVLNSTKSIVELKNSIYYVLKKKEVESFKYYYLFLYNQDLLEKTLDIINKNSNSTFKMDDIKEFQLPKDLDLISKKFNIGLLYKLRFRKKISKKDPNYSWKIFYAEYHSGRFIELFKLNTYKIISTFLVLISFIFSLCFSFSAFGVPLSVVLSIAMLPLIGSVVEIVLIRKQYRERLFELHILSKSVGLSLDET